MRSLATSDRWEGEGQQWDEAIALFVDGIGVMSMATHMHSVSAEEQMIMGQLYEGEHTNNPTRTDFLYIHAGA